MIKLSIIIPCYNVGKYIGATIESLKRQRTRDVEFIFVNDGSTDDTRQVIEKFQETDDRVKLMNKKNGGVSSARNDALEMATGEYIYLLDGDDTLTDHAVDEMLACLDMSECDMLLSNIWFVNGNRKTLYRHGIKEGIYSSDDLFEQCSKFPTPPQNVYRRAILSEHRIRFNDLIKCGEVYEFTVNFMRYAERIRVVDASFANYIMRPDSAVHKINHAADRTTLLLLRELYRGQERFTNCMSFHLTAFKMVTSFTYIKYLLAGGNSPEIKETINQVIKNPLFADVCKKVAFRPHKCLKERVLAVYMLMSGETGFNIASGIQRRLRMKHHLSVNS